MKYYISYQLLISIFFPSLLYGQSLQTDVFIDCQMYCDMNYLRQEINFVNHMQDRTQADIYVLATRQNTGAGGSEVQLLFEGNNFFNDIQDTIIYVVDPNATESIERGLMVKYLKQGLIKFLINTDLIKTLEYSFNKPDKIDSSENEVDPWNYWVFNVGGNGWLNGEESYNRLSLSGRLSANRITEKNKFEFSARYSYEGNSYTLSDGEEFTSQIKSYNFYLEYVKSITPHLSIGGISQSGSTTFGNTDVSTTIQAAIEYNIYPYSEAQTRRFSFLYSIGPEYYDYTEPTLYGYLNQWVSRHKLSMQYEQTKKWGNLYLSMGIQQYLFDLNLYNAYLNPYLEWQIFKGLSINFGGYFSFVNDRINIPQSEVSDEDILLQIKQQDTSFSYFSHFGINYRFGSKYNNFVNPRF